MASEGHSGDTHWKREAGAAIVSAGVKMHLPGPGLGSENTDLAFRRARQGRRRIDMAKVYSLIAPQSAPSVWRDAAVTESK